MQYKMGIRRNAGEGKRLEPVGSLIFNSRKDFEKFAMCISKEYSVYMLVRIYGLGWVNPMDLHRIKEDVQDKIKEYDKESIAA